MKTKKQINKEEKEKKSHIKYKQKYKTQNSTPTFGSLLRLT